MKKIQVIDFFSGCGGASQGFKSLGFEIIGAIDSDILSLNSFKRNFKRSIIINSDIRELKTKDILSRIRINREEKLILLSGCAPCQPFSQQNKNKSNEDHRIDLILEFSRFISEIKPDFIFMENVPGLIKDVYESRSPFNKFIELLEKDGYTYDFKKLKSCDYGVPQKRTRLILIASKIAPIKIPEPTHGGNEQPPYSTVRDWIYDMEKISAGQKSLSDDAHEAANLTPINLERIKNTPMGGSRADWPDNLLLNCHRNYKGHSDVYGRLHWDKLSSSLTTKCISLSNGRFGHPEQDRALSLREAACLQTFPRNFKFSGSLINKAKQVGNAVPPLLAQEIGKAFLEIAKLQ